MDAAWERGELSAAEAWRKLILTKSTFYKLVARTGRAPKRWADAKPPRSQPAGKSGKADRFIAVLEPVEYRKGEPQKGGKP